MQKCKLYTIRKVVPALRLNLWIFPTYRSLQGFEVDLVAGAADDLRPDVHISRVGNPPVDLSPESVIHMITNSISSFKFLDVSSRMTNLYLSGSVRLSVRQSVGRSF